jgi:hypothetical protein
VSQLVSLKLPLSHRISVPVELNHPVPVDISVGDADGVAVCEPHCVCADVRAALTFGALLPLCQRIEFAVSERMPHCNAFWHTVGDAHSHFVAIAFGDAIPECQRYRIRGVVQLPAVNAMRNRVPDSVCERYGNDVGVELRHSPSKREQLCFHERVGFIFVNQQLIADG